MAESRSIAWTLFALIALHSPLCDALSATATFYNDGVAGTIIFSQDQITDDVRINVDLSGLNQQAGGYHVHMYHMNKYSQTPSSGYYINGQGNQCSAAVVAGHFNPTQVPTGEDYGCSFDALELCEQGDLSGKHGVLDGLTDLSEEYLDEHITLFGADSVIGRSIVIHRNDSAASRWVCATIVDDSPRTSISAVYASSTLNVSTAIAVSSEDGGDYISAFVRYQHPGVSKDEIVFGSIKAYLTASMFDFSVDDSLPRNCPSSEVELPADAVELFSIDEANSDKLEYRVFETLSGETVSSFFAQTNKASVVFITEYWFEQTVFCTPVGKRAVSHFTSPMSGNISLYQMSSSSRVHASLYLDNLAQVAGEYHVHEFPASMVEFDCSNDGVGGHFNPFGVPASSCCESGDLSGMFSHSLEGMNSTGERGLHFITDESHTLSLYGNNSVVGRSLVIHHIDGSRLACADLSELGVVRHETVSLEMDGISGTMRFSQSAFDMWGDVSLFMAFEAPNASLEHNFHVHELPVSSGDCSSTAGHYNPSLVNAGACCEDGDLSGKSGPLDLPVKTVRTFSAPETLSLEEISGRSVVVHAANGGSPRIWCGNLNTEIDGDSIETDGATEGDRDPVVVRGPYEREGKIFVSATTVILCSLGGGMIIGLYVQKQKEEKLLDKLEKK